MTGAPRCGRSCSEWRSCAGGRGYAALREAPIHPNFANIIDLDVPRTFPENHHFQTSTMAPKLTNICHALAAARPTMGYCQGLNFIAGTFLLLLNADEEACFWAALALLSSGDKGCEVSQYYSDGMEMVLVDLAVLERLLQKHAPRISRRFGELDVSMIWFSEWLHGLFSTVASMRVTVRVWDVLLNEGWKAWFRFALAVFLLREEEILQCECLEEVMVHHKHWTKGLDPDELVAAAFSVQIKRAELRKLRARAVKTIRAKKKR